MKSPVSSMVLILQSALCRGLVSQGPKRNAKRRELCEGQYLQAHAETWLSGVVPAITPITNQSWYGECLSAP